ncbi:hypothetical protein [Streptomyces marianii]|uniref:Uncharacterized protein n=1 Tax=Streptomyces marianii TaxID=1817406 RepID=A0A5R9E1X9_9ACTN|nr:hypothetical protein [Streptomyces marianii]TLQ43055.1 hypothetical protein FEF34_07765 [Streptomyces marianii]
MHQTNGHDSGEPEPNPLTRLLAWIRRRRHALLSGALRGAAYALGAGVVGLAFWWIQQQLL